MNEIDAQEAKRLVADAGRMLLIEGLAARTWGNVSCRTGKDTMVITPSGLGYESMTADDIVPFDMAAGTWEGKRAPSSEKLIHVAAYRYFPEAGFVIHTHQTYASAFGLAGFDSLVLSEEEKAAFGGIALSKYGLPGTKKLAENVTKAYKTGAHVVLMARHGTVIVGQNREEAFSRAQLLETVCKRDCKGQGKNNALYNETFTLQIKAAAQTAFGHAAVSSAPALVKCADTFESIPAQLDDAAQMIGAHLVVIKEGERSIIQALRKHDVVLVPGVGAISRAKTEGDCHALLLLAEKACVCFLHSRAMSDVSKLSLPDVMLMRMVYLMKYSKKIGG